MVSRAAVAVGVAVLLVAAGVAGAFVAEIGPFDDDDTAGDGAPITDFPTATGTGTPYGSGGSDSGSQAGQTATEGGADLPPYAFDVTDVEECGETCRDVTVMLRNNRDVAAENVTVFTRIFAGNTTDEADLVWQGREDVGRLEAGASTTATKRVELSYSEGFAVQQRDGWITILTTVDSKDVTVTFEERRDVI